MVTLKVLGLSTPSASSAYQENLFDSLKGTASLFLVGSYIPIQLHIPFLSLLLSFLYMIDELSPVHRCYSHERYRNEHRVVAQRQREGAVIGPCKERARARTRRLFG